jgi:hypothetical protein
LSRNAPVERVVDLLATAGYQLVEGPLTVATIPFDFDATLVGSASLDLVLVVDLISKKDPGVLRRQVEGIASALDLVQSKRSLSVVLLGPSPPLDVLRALSRVSRVLSVGSPIGPRAADELNDAVAVLLPLKIDQSTGQLLESGLIARRELQTRFEDEISHSLFEAASLGPDDVENRMTAILEASFAGVDLE